MLQILFLVLFTLFPATSAKHVMFSDICAEVCPASKPQQTGLFMAVFGSPLRFCLASPLIMIFISPLVRSHVCDIGCYGVEAGFRLYASAKEGLSRRKAHDVDKIKQRLALEVIVLRADLEHGKTAHAATKTRLDQLAKEFSWQEALVAAIMEENQDLKAMRYVDA
jgi:hypothetical protein